MEDTKKLTKWNLIQNLAWPFFVLIVFTERANPQISLGWFLAVTLLFIGVIYSFFSPNKRLKKLGYLTLVLFAIVTIWTSFFSSI
ncbi:hypothetical protein [Metabacillus sp. RGM 3146]|uniref:hypothetical protein n=1 Tax=Metabacillus sp. RGM 3146 TaxID=3401092 RepID=UPI003B9A16BC